MTHLHRRASTVAAVVMAVSVVTLAGAAASPAAETTATAPAGRAGVRGVTDTTVKVGGLGPLSRYGSADIGARARFQRANAAGGVHGRTFDYVGMRDDGGTAAGNVQAASALVRDDGVFAVAPVITPDLGASGDLRTQRVPYFGWAVSSNFCGNEWGFSFTGCTFPPGGDVTSDVWGVLVRQLLGAQAAGKTAAVVSENTESGNYFVRTVSAGVSASGLRVVSGTTPLPVPPVADYDALAKQLLTVNGGAAPDVVFVAASYANVAQLRQALRNNGYAGVFTDTVEYEPDLVAAATGALVLVPTAAVETAATNPAMQQLVVDVSAVAPGHPIDQSTVAGYWSADLLIAAVERAGPKLTPDRLVRRANAKFTYRVKDTVGPVRFPAAHDEPAPCGTLVQGTGSTYAVAVPYRCGKVVDVD